MSRRRCAAGAVALMVLAGACGLGDREAQAERIIDAGKKLMASDSVAAVIGVNVKVLPVERQIVEVEPPRIAAGSLSELNATLRPRDNAASVAGALTFVDDAMYERIAPKTASLTGLAAQVAPSNLQAIVSAVQGTAVFTDRTAATTSSTTPTRVLRRTVQIVREWAAFDFAEIEDRDRTKHGGSFAVNPVALLRLTTGVLTGSIERRGGSYEANVSRDKAERRLSEAEREVLDKMFTANAITRRVFPAKFTLSPDGQLTAFEIKLRQQLSSKDRADLTVSFKLTPTAEVVTIKKPARRGTVHVSTLGQLVTTVSGA